MTKPGKVSEDVLSRIAEAISSIRYGSIQVTIQDSRVVQIEKAEKIRLRAVADLTSGGADADSPRADRTTGSSGPPHHLAGPPKADG